LEDSGQWRNPVPFARLPSKYQLIKAFVRAHPDRGYQELTFYRWTSTAKETHPEWPRLQTLALDLGVPVSWLGFGHIAVNEIDLLIRFKVRRGIPSLPPPPPS